MTARESAAVERAAQDVLQNEKSQAEAARTHGVSYSSLTRSLRRRGVPPLGPRRRQPSSPKQESSNEETSQRGASLFTERSTLSAQVQAENENGVLENRQQLFVTPLLRFIRGINEYPLELESFVSALEKPSGKRRTGVYLYQLAAQAFPNPTLRLAKAIVDQSRIYGDRLGIHPLTYEELLIGTAAGDV